MASGSNLSPPHFHIAFFSRSLVVDKHNHPALPDVLDSPSTVGKIGSRFSLYLLNLGMLPLRLAS